MKSMSVVRGPARSRRKTECCRFELREWTHPGEHSLHALWRYAPGDVLSPFQARAVSAEPTRLSLQAGEFEHIELTRNFSNT